MEANRRAHGTGGGVRNLSGQCSAAQLGLQTTGDALLDRKGEDKRKKMNPLERGLSLEPNLSWGTTLVAIEPSGARQTAAGCPKGAVGGWRDGIIRLGPRSASHDWISQLVLPLMARTDRRAPAAVEAAGQIMRSMTRRARQPTRGRQTAESSPQGERSESTGSERVNKSVEEQDHAHLKRTTDCEAVGEIMRSMTRRARRAKRASQPFSKTDSNPQPRNTL